MDIYLLLKTDHEKLFQTLDCLERMVDSPQQRRKDVLDYFRKEILIHSKCEEKVFYNAIAEASNSETRMDLSRDEHEEVADLLDNLEDMEVDERAFPIALRMLHAKLEAHIAKEETEIFGLAKTILSGNQATNLAYEMLAEKGRMESINPLIAMRQKFESLVDRHD